MCILRNKMSLRRIGEVAIRQSYRDGIGFISNPCKNIEETSIPRNFIININDYGTGFIIRRLVNPIYVRDRHLYAIALFCTAAHVVTDLIIPDNSVTPYLTCKVDGSSEEFKCLLLKAYHTEFPEDALNSNNVSYCAGQGDIALMILLSKKCDSTLFSMEIAKIPLDIEGQECIIAGYPSGFKKDPLYNYPYSKDIAEARESLKNIFKSTHNIICSPGTVKWAKTVLEVTSSACSGMLGSPIICQDKIVGILVGGPALNGHRIFFKAAIELLSDDIQNSFSTFSRFFSFEALYEIDIEIINSTYKELIRDKEKLIDGNFQDRVLGC